MTARPSQAATAEATAYARKLTIQGARERVFGAIATLDGLRRWRTTIVTGSATPGGTLRFGFAGPDEQIVMRVDVVRPLSAITWSCVAHTRNDEWTGSTRGCRDYRCRYGDSRAGWAGTGPSPPGTCRSTQAVCSGLRAGSARRILPRRRG